MPNINVTGAYDWSSNVSTVWDCVTGGASSYLLSNPQTVQLAGGESPTFQVSGIVTGSPEAALVNNGFVAPDGLDVSTGKFLAIFQEDFVEDPTASGIFSTTTTGVDGSRIWTSPATNGTPAMRIEWQGTNTGESDLTERWLLMYNVTPKQIISAPSGLSASAHPTDINWSAGIGVGVFDVTGSYNILVDGESTPIASGWDIGGADRLQEPVYYPEFSYIKYDVKSQDTFEVTNTQAIDGLPAYARKLFLKILAV